MVLQIHQQDARIVPSTALPLHILHHQMLFNDPIHLMPKLHRIVFQAVQHRPPAANDLRLHGVFLDGPQIFHRPLEIHPLNLKRRQLASIFQLDFLL